MVSSPTPPNAALPTIGPPRPPGSARIGIEASPEQIVITGGAHQAIVTVLRGARPPGRAGPGRGPDLRRRLPRRRAPRPAARRASRSTTRGCCPRRSRRPRRAAGARLLFVNPTDHNPTTATLSQARREAIVACARQPRSDPDRGRRLRPAARAPAAAARGAGARAHGPHQQRVQERRARAPARHHRESAGAPAAHRRGPARSVPDLPAADGGAVPALARNGTADRLARAPADRGDRPPGARARAARRATTIAPSRPAITSGCRCRRPGAPSSSPPRCASAGWRSIRARASRSTPPTRRMRSASRSAPRPAASAWCARSRVLAETLDDAPARRREVI